MPGPLIRLREEERTKRRSIADAIDVVSRFGLPSDSIGRIQVGPLRLPAGDRICLVEVVFPHLGYAVSLPTSARFKARTMTHSIREGDIRLLSNAKVQSDGTVVLRNGERLRAVEVVPGYLPYKPSLLDLRILRHVIALMGADSCYRSIREGLPEPYRDMMPDFRAIDFGRISSLRVPQLKVIQGYIEEHEPALAVSSQKISDALAALGVRRPRRRRARSPVPLP